MSPAFYPLIIKGKPVLVIRTEREDGKQILKAIAPDGSESKVSRRMAKRIARLHQSGSEP